MLGCDVMLCMDGCRYMYLMSGKVCKVHSVAR